MKLNIQKDGVGDAAFVNRKNTKRILYAFLVVSILIACMPVSAFAAVEYSLPDELPIFNSYTTFDGFTLTVGEIASTFTTLYFFPTGNIAAGTKDGTVVQLYTYDYGWLNDSYRNWTFNTADLDEYLIYWLAIAHDELTPDELGVADIITDHDNDTSDSGDTGDSSDSSTDVGESYIDPGDFNVIHYQDYVLETYFDGESDAVVVSFPVELVRTYVYTDTGDLIETHTGTFSSTITESGCRLVVSLLGTEFIIDNTDGFSYDYMTPVAGDILDLTDFPEDTVVTVDVDFALGSFMYNYSWLFEYVLTDAFSSTMATAYKTVFTKYDDYFNLTYDLPIQNYDNHHYAAYCIDLYQLSLGDYSVNVNSITMTFQLNSLMSWYEQGEVTNELLEDILTSLQGSEEDQTDVDNFGEEVQDNQNRYEDAQDKLDSVEKPNMGDIDIDVNTVIGSDNMAAGATVLAVLTGIPLVTTQLGIVVVLMLVAYVFFGKRG